MVLCKCCYRQWYLVNVVIGNGTIITVNMLKQTSKPTKVDDNIGSRLIEQRWWKWTVWWTLTVCSAFDWYVFLNFIYQHKQGVQKALWLGSRWWWHHAAGIQAAVVSHTAGHALHHSDMCRQSHFPCRSLGRCGHRPCFRRSLFLVGISLIVACFYLETSCPPVTSTSCN